MWLRYNFYYRVPCWRGNNARDVPCWDCSNVTSLNGDLVAHCYRSQSNTVVQLREIPYFWHFVWFRQPADADCVISVECYSELLYHVSNNWEVLTWWKCTDYNENRKSYRYSFIVQGLPNVLTRDLVTLNNTLSRSHSPRALRIADTKCRKYEISPRYRVTMCPCIIYRVYFGWIKINV